MFLHTYREEQLYILHSLQIIFPWYFYIAFLSPYRCANTQRVRSVSGIWRGVLFCAKRKCAVFYSDNKVCGAVFYSVWHTPTHWCICTPIGKRNYIFLIVYKSYFLDTYSSHFSLSIGVQIHSVSGVCQAPGAVFYSVLRENARCFILCDTLLNCTPIGESNYIFLSLFQIIFPFNQDNLFLSPYRCANQEYVGHFARCFILC